MFSVKVTTWAAFISALALPLLVLGVEVNYNLSADEWSAIGQLASAVVAVPGFLLIAAQLAHGLRQRREEQSPQIVLHLEHGNPQNPGADVNLVIENAGGGAARQVLLTFNPPLPDGPEAVRLKKLIESPFPLLSAGKQIKTNFIFGSISTAGFADNYTVTVFYGDGRLRSTFSESVEIDVVRMRWFTVVS